MIVLAVLNIVAGLCQGALTLCLRALTAQSVTAANKLGQTRAIASSETHKCSYGILALFIPILS